MSETTGTGAPFPPPAPTTLQVTIKSYLYDQYTDDPTLPFFVEAFNIMQTWVLAWWNQAGLPYWPGLTGALLDWIGAGLYGYPRPTLSYTQTVDLGGYATAFYGQLGYAEASTVSTTTLIPVTDDVYQRMLTWHLYLGDGWQFTTRWLKQRVHRFLNGANGVLPVNDNTFDVSIKFTAPNNITITVAPSLIAQILQYAIMDGVLALPEQYNFSVVLASPSPPVSPSIHGIAITTQEVVNQRSQPSHVWVRGPILRNVPVPIRTQVFIRQEEVHQRVPSVQWVRGSFVPNLAPVSGPVTRRAITTRDETPALHSPRPWVRKG